MTARRHRAPTALLLAVAALLAGCGSDGPAAPPAEALLTAARTSLATAATVHFVLDSEGAPSSGLALLGGEGDAARPDRLRGTLKVRVAGLSADVDVVAVDGTFYARLPLAPGLTRTDPSTLGFGDPGALFSVGLTTLLDAARDPRDAGQERVDGEVVDTVAVTFPGPAVADVLRSAEPGTDFQGRVGLTRGDPRQVRRVTLTGPFYSGATTTYTIVLTRYGEPVDISAPAG